MKKATEKKNETIARRLMLSVATYYANVACPFLTYQPKQPNEVKNLRKF